MGQKVSAARKLFFNINDLLGHFYVKSQLSVSLVSCISCFVCVRACEVKAAPHTTAVAFIRR